MQSENQDWPPKDEREMLDAEVLLMRVAANALRKANKKARELPLMKDIIVRLEKLREAIKR